MNMLRKGALLCLGTLLAAFTLAVRASATTWHVGLTRVYKTPCSLKGVVAEGDTIVIDYSPSSGPGVGYYDDTCNWTVNNLTFIGVLGPGGARPVLNCAGLTDTPTTGHISGYKGIWVISGDNTVIENMEFENAMISNDDGANGAGIRMQGTNLTLINCYFHNNQDGLLESNIAGSNIVIKNTEFAYNGVSNPNLDQGYGYTHNLYIGNCASLLFEYSYTHDANVGHLLKSRAAVNYILYNRITGQNGTDSYEIDLPNGGTSYVIGNEIQQGPNTQNSTILTYLEEGTNPNNPGTDLYVVNNTFVNQYPTGYFVYAAPPAAPVWLQNNIFYGPGTVTNDASANRVDNFSILSRPHMFVSLADYNYNLTAAAGWPPMNDGSEPGKSSEGFSLVPLWQYVQKTDAAGYVECEQPRERLRPHIDIGAYEFGNDTAVTCP